MTRAELAALREKIADAAILWVRAGRDQYVDPRAPTALSPTPELRDERRRYAELLTLVEQHDGAMPRGREPA